jgi:hypothetical protein
MGIEVVGYLRQFEAEVRAFMMRGAASRRALRATKMGSGLPWPSGSSLRSHPASTGRDAVERQLGVNAQQALGLARGEMRVGIEAQAALELGQRVGGQAKPTAKAWPPKRVKRSAQLSMAASS